ncbi:MAG TPA: TolC family protein [Polyangiaceae bacterium]|jgi:cobalt-zinc-cadmium efflux system outer membrane protein
MRRLAVCLVVLATASTADARDIDYAEVLSRVRLGSPDVIAARAKEGVSRAGVRVAGELPNPTVSVGTFSQTAKVAVDVSLPVLLFGQRGAAMDAARAELRVTRADTRVTESEIRAAAARAFVALWTAERFADARRESATIAAQIEQVVQARVDAGTAPELDRLRVHAERLRADADVADAEARMDAAGAALGVFIGLDGIGLRARGDPAVPASVPSYASLAGRVERNPIIDRDHFDALAALARAHHERALARPALVFDVGVNALDPTLPGPDFHATLGVEVPIVSWRQPMVDRERASAAAAEAQRSADRTRAAADLAAAYQLFTAATQRTHALEAGVAPAMIASARASREAYALGHSPLLAVLDAERARLEGALELVAARAERANAWIDVEHAVGEL